MRLNTKGQLTSGEWCNDKDGSGSSLTVQWCQMGTVNGPWKYIPEQKQMFHRYEIVIGSVNGLTEFRF